jgi:hypothetical protein
LTNTSINVSVVLEKQIQIYTCDVCGFHSANAEEVEACEARDHGVNLGSQFQSLTNDSVIALKSRIEAIGNRDKKPMLDSPGMALRSVLYTLYVKKHYTVLSAALSELERLYAKDA